MKLGFLLPTLLLVLLVLSSVEEMELFVDGSNSIGVPEHTCHKVIEHTKCKQERCRRECSQEPGGAGECRGAVCQCRFFCLQPPE